MVHMLMCSFQVVFFAVFTDDIIFVYGYAALFSGSGHICSNGILMISMRSMGWAGHNLINHPSVFRRFPIFHDYTDVEGNTLG